MGFNPNEHLRNLKDRRYKTLADKLWRRIEERDGCWLFTGPLSSKGYAQVHHEGRRVAAHRIAYELFFGPIPDGLVLDHKCRNRNCVNPLHLEAVTDRENILRGEGIAATRAKQTHCKHGHEFSPENTYVYVYRGRVGRFCKTCRDERLARFRMKQKGVA